MNTCSECKKILSVYGRDRGKMFVAQQFIGRLRWEPVVSCCIGLFPAPLTDQLPAIVHSELDALNTWLPKVNTGGTG